MITTLINWGFFGIVVLPLGGAIIAGFIFGWTHGSIQAEIMAKRRARRKKGIETW